MGTDTFCANTLARTALKIEADLQALAVFPHLHQRIKIFFQFVNVLQLLCDVSMRVCPDGGLRLETFFNSVGRRPL